METCPAAIRGHVRTTNCNRWRVTPGERGLPSLVGEKQMAKKIAIISSCRCPPANLSPPIGPALGQRGLNIMEFCRAFNAKTQQMEKGCRSPSSSAYQDRPSPSR